MTEFAQVFSKTVYLIDFQVDKFKYDNEYLWRFRWNHWTNFKTHYSKTKHLEYEYMNTVILLSVLCDDGQAHSDGD